jgi:hypothetical protein
MGDTNFVESDILLAVIRDDWIEAAEYAGTMTAKEIHRLRVSILGMDTMLRVIWGIKVREGDHEPGRDHQVGRLRP